MTVTPAGSSPPSSQPRSIAPPILPAPASASVRGQSVISAPCRACPTGFPGCAKAACAATALVDNGERRAFALAFARGRADLDAMKFPPEFLDEIKARLPAGQVVGQRVKLKKAGARMARPVAVQRREDAVLLRQRPEAVLPRLLLRQARQHLQLPDGDRGPRASPRRSSGWRARPGSTCRATTPKRAARDKAPRQPARRPRAGRRSLRAQSATSRRAPRRAAISPTARLDAGDAARRSGSASRPARSSRCATRSPPRASTPSR